MKRNVYYALSGTVLLSGFVASVAVVTTSTASKSITAEVTAFTSAPPYTVTFEVDKPLAESVTCEVWEVSFDDYVVGDLPNIKIGPTKEHSTTVRVTVPVTGGKPNQPQVRQCVRDRP